MSIVDDAGSSNSRTRKGAIAEAVAELELALTRCGVKARVETLLGKNKIGAGKIVDIADRNGWLRAFFASHEVERLLAAITVRNEFVHGKSTPSPAQCVVATRTILAAAEKLDGSGSQTETKVSPESGPSWSAKENASSTRSPASSPLHSVHTTVSSSPAGVYSGSVGPPYTSSSSSRSPDCSATGRAFSSTASPRRVLLVGFLALGAIVAVVFVFSGRTETQHPERTSTPRAPVTPAPLPLAVPTAAVISQSSANSSPRARPSVTEETVAGTEAVRGVTLLRASGTANLMVVFTQQDAQEQPGTVRFARRSSDWAVTDLVRGYWTYRGGAAVDRRGIVHLGLTNGESTFYISNSGGSWSAPVVVPDLPAKNPVLDVDDQGFVYITANTHIQQRGFATNVSGAWHSSLFSDPSTGAAAILAHGGGLPLVTYAVRHPHQIIRRSGVDLDERTLLLNSYALDQYSPQILRAHRSRASLVYLLATNGYRQAAVYFQALPAVGVAPPPHLLFSSAPAALNRDWELPGLGYDTDGNGRHLIALCDQQNALHILTLNSNGRLQRELTAEPACYGAVDALVSAGRFTVAFRNQTGSLSLISWPVSLL